MDDDLIKLDDGLLFLFIVDSVLFFIVYGLSKLIEAGY